MAAQRAGDKSGTSDPRRPHQHSHINGAHDANGAGHNDDIHEISTSFPDGNLRDMWIFHIRLNRCVYKRNKKKKSYTTESKVQFID